MSSLETLLLYIKAHPTIEDALGYHLDTTNENDIPVRLTASRASYALSKAADQMYPARITEEAAAIWLERLGVA
jgi:hypothetical protein